MLVLLFLQEVNDQMYEIFCREWQETNNDGDQRILKAYDPDRSEHSCVPTIDIIGRL